MRYRRKIAAAGMVAALLMFLFPAVASATVNGGCEVTGSASVSGDTDLTTTAVWHLKTTDVVNGSAKYPEQTEVHVYVFIFGIPIPIYTSSGKDTKGSAGPFKVSDWSKYTRVFAAGGSSDSCTGAVVIVVDDQSPYTNAVGIGGLVLAGLGLIGLIFLLVVSHGPAGCGAGIFGGLGGLLLGLGLALTATEAGVLSPDQYGGLIVTGVFVVLGVMAPIIKGRMG